MHLTWKDNYKAVSTKCNSLFNTSYNWETNPQELATDNKAAIYSGVAFFHMRLNGNLAPLHKNDVKNVSKLVNGGTNGLSQRKNAYNRLITDIYFNCIPKKD